MAEAFYNHITDSSDAISAGLLDFTPAKYVHPIKDVIDVMAEEGIDVSQNKVKFLTQDMLDNSEKVYVLCEKDKCPGFLLQSDKVTFWENISDPYQTSVNNFRDKRDLIKERVLSLIKN